MVTEAVRTNVPLDRTHTGNDNTNNPSTHVADAAIPRPGESNPPTATRPDTSAPHLPGVELYSNQVQIEKNPDGTPKAYHSNGFSFEYHDSDKQWYYHQDGGGHEYVKINAPHVNDDGTVTAYERDSIFGGRQHTLQASGQTTEGLGSLHNRILGQGWQATKEGLAGSTLSHMIGDTVRGDQQAWNDLKNGNILGALGDIGKRDVNAFDDLISAASGKPPTRAWNAGQQLEADLARHGANSPEFKRDLDTLNQLWDGTGYGGTTRGDVKFYDDNNWIGIALVDAYKQNGSKEYLQRAEDIFNFVQQGEQGTDKMKPPGGVLWEQGKDYRAAVSTAGAEQLALSLYQQTGDKKYLDFAERQHQWMDTTLKGPNGLYYDGVDPNGSVDSHKDQWSYNQGLMLGNATMLYETTHDPKYLQEAQQIAKDSLKAFGKDGSERDFTEQNVFFNAVFFKNLMQLDAIAPDNSYRQALAKYNYDLKGILGSGKNDGVYENRELTMASAAQVAALANQYPAS